MNERDHQGNYKIVQSEIISDPNSPDYKTSSTAFIPMEADEANDVQGAPLTQSLHPYKHEEPFLSRARVYGAIGNAAATTFTILECVSNHIGQLDTASGAIVVGGMIFAASEGAHHLFKPEKSQKPHQPPSTP